MMEAFRQSRKKLLRLSLVSFGLTLLALAIVGTKLFYPFHMVIGVGIYILSFIPLGRRIYLSRKAWREYQAYTWSASFFKKEWLRLVYVSIFIVVTITFFWLRPLDDNPFKGFTDKQIAEMVADDLYQSVTAMDYLETSGNELLELLESGREDPLLNEDITAAFTTFLEAVAFSESLTEQHRYFASRLCLLRISLNICMQLPKFRK